MIDGTLIPIDRVAADRPFYSGKHRRHGMNLQVIATPGGDIVWVSGPLPGAVHDLTAARIWGIVRELAAAGLVVLADKGYHGAGDHVRIPYRGRNKPASQKDANRAHAQLRVPRRTRQRPAQDLAHPAQTPLLPLARRAAGQSHPRPSSPRDRRMKKAQYRADAALSRLLPPSPATPGSGCLQLHPTAATARRWTVSHLHPEQQRLVAHPYACQMTWGTRFRPVGGSSARARSLTVSASVRCRSVEASR